MASNRPHTWRDEAKLNMYPAVDAQVVAMRYEYDENGFSQADWEAAIDPLPEDCTAADVLAAVTKRLGELLNPGKINLDEIEEIPYDNSTRRRDR